MPYGFAYASFNPWVSVREDQLPANSSLTSLFVLLLAFGGSYDTPSFLLLCLNIIRTDYTLIYHSIIALKFKKFS